MSNTQHSNTPKNSHTIPHLRQEIAFVDTSVVDYQSLVDGLPADMEVVLIDGQQDGLQQIADWAQNNSGYDAIHILSHGSDGQVQLGTTNLNSNTLADYSAQLAQIGQSLTEDGDILLYGCNVAASESGVDFIGKLAQATNADIAASDDLTGAEAKDGDWVLEVSDGQVQTNPILINAYDSTLDVMDSTVSFMSGYDTATVGSGVEFIIPDFLDIDITSNQIIITGTSNVGIFWEESFDLTFSGDDFASIDSASLNGSSDETVTITYDTDSIIIGALPSPNEFYNGEKIYIDFTSSATSTAPTITNVALTSALGIENDFLNEGDTVTATVTFSEAVNVTGTPQLALNIGGTTVQANYADGTGTTALTFSYTIQAGQTDANGISIDADSLSLNSGTIQNASNDDATLTFSAVADNASYKVDTTAPAAPSVPDLDAASDSGASNTDNITNDTTPTVSGTAEANSSVTLYATDGTTSLGTATADGSGAWSITSTALSDGSHTLTAKATDAAGNESDASSGLNITVDTTAATQSASTSSNLAQTTATVSSTSDEVGIMYYVVTTSSSAPSAAQVIDGQDHVGSAATASGSDAVVAATAENFSVTGLTASTQYYAYFVTVDSAGNQSSVASTSFTTANPNAAPTLVGSLSDLIVLEETASNIDLSALTFADAENDILTVTLSVDSGTFAAPADGAGVGNGVTETLNSGSGSNVITLIGLADDINTYLATASNIQYTGANNVSGNNAATLTISAQDATGHLSSNPTINLDITDINDAPTLTATASNPTFTENGSAASLFSAAAADTIESGQTFSELTLTVTNVSDTTESLTLDGSTVSLTDAATGTTQTNGLTYNVAVAGGTATVSLTNGTLTNAQLQTLINAIAYSNSDDAPNTDNNRVVTITEIKDSGGVTNGGVDTTALSLASTVTVEAANDAPVLGGTLGTTWTENTDTGAAIYSGDSPYLFTNPTLTDPDTDTDFNGATLTVGLNSYQTGDLISLPLSSGNVTFDQGASTISVSGTQVATISGGIGQALVLTFNANATKSSIEQVMAAVTYTIYGNDDPSAGDRTLTATFNDKANANTDTGALTGQITGTLTVVATNDAPTYSATGRNPTFTEGSDSTPNWASLPLLFTDNVFNTIEAGQEITQVTATITNVTDAQEFIGLRTDASSSINMALVDGESDTITGSLNFSYQVSMSGTTATLVITSSDDAATWGNYGALLFYHNASDTPTEGDRIVTITSVKDDGGTENEGQDTATGLTVSSTVTVVAVNDAPVLNNLNGDTVSYSIGGSAVTLDAGTALSASDVDNTTLASATVQITGNLQTAEDVLAFSNDGSTMGNISAAYDAGTGTLTLSSAGATATLAEWTAALAAVTYENTEAATVNTATRTLTWTLNDGSANSTAVTSDISLVRAPIIDLDGDDSSGATNGGYNASFTEGSGAIAIIDADATLEDDGANLNQAIITLTNPQTDDLLSLQGRTTGDVVNGITITYTSASVITLSGVASKADYLALLQEARFNNTSSTPDTTDRTITFSARDTDNHTGSVVSAKVGITLTNDAPTGEVTITGTATQGQTLTASNDLADADGMGTVTYQWYAGGTAIDGATAETFTLTQAQVGKAITVKASYTDDQGFAQEVESSATNAVANINDAPTGDVTITGTTTQGQTLTADISTLADADGIDTDTLTYQWLRDGQAITGATGETYTLTSADVGAEISVSVNYTDDQGTDETVDSSATNAVVAAPAPEPPAPPAPPPAPPAPAPVPPPAPAPEPPAPPAPPPAPPQQGEVTLEQNEQTVDGIKVINQVVQLADGTTTERVLINPISSERQEDSATPNSQLADIPLFWGESSRNEFATTASLPVGVGIETQGARAPVEGRDTIGDLVGLIDQTAPGADPTRGDMLSGAESFLQNLAQQRTETLVINKITLTSQPDIGASSAPIVISGTAQPVTTPTGQVSAPVEALVIDARSLPAGTEINLENIEFAVIIGDNVTVRGGEGANIFYAGAGSQNIRLGADDDILYAGDGDDWVGSEGGDDQLFGESGHDVLYGGTGDDVLDGGEGIDFALYQYARAEYSVHKLDNGTWQISHAIEGTDTLINIEYAEFADQTLRLADNDGANLMQSGLLFF